MKDFPRAKFKDEDDLDIYSDPEDEETYENQKKNNNLKLT